MALLRFLHQQGIGLIVMVLAAVFVGLTYRGARRVRSPIPVSVNYHFTRHCKKSCGFCFHTAKTSHILPEEDAKRGLKLLKDAGMRKINFAGGEPFLYQKFLGNMLEYCKDDLKLEAVSIVTNGSKVTEKFLRRYGQYIDVLAVSCDSFNEQTNIEIGRGSGDNVAKLFQIAQWCRQFGIKFKLNTVVCKMNYQEDMVAKIEQLQPFRWKCFQVLCVEGENDSEYTLRDVRKFQIEDEQYEEFCARHKHLPCFIKESNSVMASSYLILDEYMRFLDKGAGQVETSESILDVGVYKALSQVRWDRASFDERGGVYDWSRDVSGGGHQNGCGSKLEW